MAICEAGQYEAPSGAIVQIGALVEAAVAGTELHRPEEFAQHLESAHDLGSLPPTPRMEVTEETTQVAAHRLVQLEGVDRLALLNFASARNPGGGFINGAKAQEEDVTRCSSLHPCLMKPSVWPYYEANRETDSLLYTDHLVYSPDVPFFRTRSRDLIELPFVASILTGPAPNAGQVLRQDQHDSAAIEATLRRRAGKILAAAQHHGHETLLLGAWGCGVFMNDAAIVADAFGEWLASPCFRGAFERVVFAVYDRTKDRRVLGSFRRRFEAMSNLEPRASSVPLPD